MSKLDFFTAVNFEEYRPSWSQWLLVKADDYFFLKGQKACVISGQELQDNKETLLLEQDQNVLFTVLKVISYFTGFFPIIMLLSKALLRSQHHFHLIDPQQKLEEGIDVSVATIVKIEKLMPKILERENDPELTYHSNGQHYAFSLASAPHLIFKMRNQHIPDTFGSVSVEYLLSTTPNSRTEENFKNLIKAKAVCLYHDLDKLVIPHAKLFTLNGNKLIVHERIDIAPTKNARKRQYQDLPATSLHKAIKQLATFLAKNPFPVTWKNIPLVLEAPTFQGQRRIALIDLKKSTDTSAEVAMFGTWGGTPQYKGRGLIRCLPSEELMNIALQESHRQGVTSLDSDELIKTRRMQELQ